MAVNCPRRSERFRAVCALFKDYCLHQVYGTPCDTTPQPLDDHRDPTEIEMDEWYNNLPDSLGG